MYGYPVIVKPDVGVGAAKTYRVDDDDMLVDVLGEISNACLVEQMLTGDLISFDGLTNRNGEVVFYTSHEFNAGIMDIVNEERQMHYYSVREPHPALVDLGMRTVQAFNLRERFFHIEFFRSDPETYHALEVNVRPPGGFTIDMMNYACDIDICRLWANLVAGRLPRFPYERKYFTAHASRRRRFDYKQRHEELLVRLGTMIAAYTEVPDVYSGAMGDSAYLLRSPDLANLKRGIALVEERFDDVPPDADPVENGF